MSNSPQAFMSSLKRVRVLCRNNKVVHGDLKMYDKHLNIIIFTDEKREIFIRGDGIITISKASILNEGI